MLPWDFWVVGGQRDARKLNGYDGAIRGHGGYGHSGDADAAVCNLPVRPPGRFVWCSGVRTNFTEDERTALAAFLRDRAIAAPTPDVAALAPDPKRAQVFPSATRAAASPAAETPPGVPPSLGAASCALVMLDEQQRRRPRLARRFRWQDHDAGNRVRTVRAPRAAACCAADRAAPLGCRSSAASWPAIPPCRRGSIMMGCGVLAGASSRCTTGVLPTR